MSPPSGVGAETEEKAVETAWRIHGAVGEWTARVDAKAAFALTLESAAAAGIIALSGSGNIFADLHGWGARSLLWAGSAFILIGAVFAVLVVVPRLRAPRMQDEASGNFVYFGHLMHREATELANSLRRTDTVLPVLSRQLIVMSKIVWRKHRHVQLSLAFFTLGLLLVLIAAVLA
ncbi:Pycsar system effector family protein [Streptomyces cyaneofuscatus]|uniref:Pycsar system effector family protein n=1 Tax=Streptomyces cyaneofuscatus TaxID=66883 RepID=UPI0038133AD0